MENEPSGKRAEPRFDAPRVEPAVHIEPRSPLKAPPPTVQPPQLRPGWVARVAKGVAIAFGLVVVVGVSTDLIPWWIGVQVEKRMKEERTKLAEEKNSVLEQQRLAEEEVRLAKEKSSAAEERLKGAGEKHKQELDKQQQALARHEKEAQARKAEEEAKATALHKQLEEEKGRLAAAKLELEVVRKQHDEARAQVAELKRAEEARAKEEESKRGHEARQLAAEKGKLAEERQALEQVRSQLADSRQKVEEAAKAVEEARKKRVVADGPEFEAVDRDLAEGHLIEPKGSSALEKLEALERARPGQGAVQCRWYKMAEALLAETEAAVQTGQVVKAERNLAAAQRIPVARDKVSAASQRLKQVQADLVQQERANLLRQAEEEERQRQAKRGRPAKP